MAAPCFITWNASTSALTAPMAGTTVAAQKTVLQVAPTKKIRLVEWGYMFPTNPVAPIQVELVETGTVFATVTAGVIATYNDATGPSSAATVSTTATGFNASAEGTITASRLLAQNFDSGVYFKQQFPLGREPEVNANSALRIRVTPTASIVVLAYAIWEE